MMRSSSSNSINRGAEGTSWAGSGRDGSDRGQTSGGKPAYRGRWQPPRLGQKTLSEHLVQGRADIFDADWFVYDGIDKVAARLDQFRGHSVAGCKDDLGAGPPAFYLAGCSPAVHFGHS